MHSAMSSVEAKRLCPEFVFVSGDMKRYAAESRRIFEIFDRIRRASKGCPSTKPSSTSRERSGFSARRRKWASDCVARFVRRLASDLRRDRTDQDGCQDRERRREARRIAGGPAGRGPALPRSASARKIWGVGPVAGQRLEGFGYRTIGDLARAEPATLRARLGDWGESIGRPRAARTFAKSSHTARRFRSRKRTPSIATSRIAGVLEATILTHAESVAAASTSTGLRADRRPQVAPCPTNTKEGPRGYPARTRQLTLAEPTDDGDVIAQVAKSLLDDALAEPVRLLGVGVSGLVDESGGAAQLSLFGVGPSERRASRSARDAGHAAQASVEPGARRPRRPVRRRRRSTGESGGSAPRDALRTVEARQPRHRSPSEGEEGRD